MKQPPLSGRYELEEIVGSGGMSVVYRAWDLKSDREVAVKVLRFEHNADQDFVRQFNREAQAASKVTHPNIVSMYDVGQDGDTRYLVMEYVKGVTLKDMIRQQGRIECRRAVQIALKILAAVDHAHKNNIVHRDIKPQNILVDSEGRVKVTDFGIARVLDSSSNTGTGNVLGSVHYFSPEQARGAVADAKSDLYSVGVVLYEMVTGRVPFDADTPMAIALKHIHEKPVPPTSQNPAVWISLDEVIMKALEKDPDKRYQSAAQMASDLKLAVKHPNGGVVRVKEDPEPHPRRFPGWIVPALAVAALAVALLFTWQVSERLKTRVRVPSMVMADLEDAQAQLDAQGLALELERRYDDSVVSGVVIAQDPEPGALVYPGASVRLAVSMGKEAVTVPDVTMHMRNEAVQMLEEADLMVGEVRLEISDDVPVGAVISQYPPAEMKAPPFSEVSLTVSGESTAVPELGGLTVELARVTLQASGLQLGDMAQEDSDEPAGTIIGQSFTAGVRVLWGTPVDVIVSATDNVTYWTEVVLNMTIADNGTTVRAVLSDGETEREVYRSVLNAGEQVISMNLDSAKAGLQTLQVYVSGELSEERTVEFGNE
ncbi:MAG: protein kinase [Clostridia bacterium]|nr:protein kinase [Clostridia bacterium]